MTTTAMNQESAQVDAVHLTFGVPKARELATVLPWVLQALEDRPGLTDKQRRRRQMTQSALNDLLGQLSGGLAAFPTTNGADSAVTH